MNGFIILDKPTGISSRAAGARVTRMLGVRTFGHIGTLDPMASGVLPIAIGAATKMIPYVEDANPNTKEYLFGVQFGFETDTLDINGTEIRRTDIVPTDTDVINAISGMIGEIMQTPPAYSAVHVNGARAYDLARRGIAPELPARKITIYALEFLGRSCNTWNFRTRCSRGTYVRAIVRDIAQKCGTVATVDMIRRTYTTGIDIKNAVKLDFLENLINNGGDIGKYLMPPDFGLGDIPVTNLDDGDAALYAHGGFIATADADGPRRVYNGDKFIGVGYVTGGTLRPKRTL